MFGGMSFVDLLRASPTLVVLILCSIVTLAFVVERLLYFKSSTMNVEHFLRELAPKLGAGDYDAALSTCRKRKGAVPRVLEQGLCHLHLTRPELKQRMDTAIEVEQVEMERNIGVLGTMSNIGPLVGLFGTVVGIIRAFADIARTGAGGSAVVAMGVAEALITTAAGILVAVIATVFYNVLVRRIRIRVVELEDAREEFLSQLSHRQPHAPAAATPGTRGRVVQEPAPAGFLG
jgi:biopolymer transport protein ExbB